MPEYEKNCISEYSKDQIYEYLNDQNESVMPISQINNQRQNTDYMPTYVDDSGFKELETNIKNELLSIDAMQDSLKQKQEYEQLKKKNQNKQKELELELQKMVAGKKTLKTIFTKSSQ